MRLRNEMKIFNSRATASRYRRRRPYPWTKNLLIQNLNQLRESQHQTNKKKTNKSEKRTFKGKCVSVTLEPHHR